MKLCNIFIFGLAFALNEHGLKIPILTTPRFGPQFSFSQHFEQRNCSLPHFFVWHTVLDDLFQMLACFLYSRTMFSDKQSEHSFSQASNDLGTPAGRRVFWEGPL